MLRKVYTRRAGLSIFARIFSSAAFTIQAKGGILYLF